MSLIPLVFSDWWEDLDRPHHLLDQDFGLGLTPDQLLSPRRLDLYYPNQQRQNALLDYMRPWTGLLRNGTTGGASTVENEKNQFQVTLDVQQFKPDEINVKVVDRFVVVNAKHEEKLDEHGWVSRQFTRKYLIPEQCDIEKVISKLSSDGVLSILIPRKEEPKPKNEKVIKIQHTGKPALKTTKNETEKNAEKK